ncbi:MAG: LapA family protein [Flavobacterium sp.]
MVKVRFLFFGFELPLFILIAIVFFIGYYTAIAFRKRKTED